MGRQFKLAGAVGLMFVGLWMMLGSPVRAAIWTAIQFGFIWLVFRVPPEDRHVKP